ncbi:MAG: MerR family transcriptional regulator [Pseudomonadota bacterium]|nr:MerR family transcriptional regulator [Pseudomonadota bacterium]
MGPTGDILADDSDDPAPRLGFDHHKSPKAFRTIGEVAKALGIRQHVLRYWEEQFPMLSPVKRSGNRRYYRPGDVELIETIDRLVHHQGYTLRGARLALDGKSAAKAAAIPLPAENVAAELALTEIATQPGARLGAAPWLSELLDIRATLAAALES